MPVDLAGRPIVITGASSGIGRETAIRCARRGMPVLVSARREEKLRELVDCIEREGGRAASVVGDVTSKDANEEMVETCVERFGGIYAAFANAGYGYELPIDEQTDEQLRAIFETNFFGTMHTINAALPRLKAQREGHIVINSSCIGLMPVPYNAAYCATKAAQHHIGRALNTELRPFNIRCSTVHPIGTRTEFFNTAKANSGDDAVQTEHAPSWAMQPAATVANAVVRCLRRPRPEVWTSLPIRLGICLGLLTPSLVDVFFRRYIRRREAVLEARDRDERIDQP